MDHDVDGFVVIYLIHYALLSQVFGEDSPGEIHSGAHR